MHDPFLKSVFADRRMVEILIRGHAPEWADEIDFTTLREEPTQLVAKRTLQLRHPDLIWSADTLGGGRVMFLIEFQRTTERLMALRTATQLAALRLTVEGHGDAGLDAFMVERVDTVLALRGYPEELKLGGAKTMAEMVDRFQKGLDKLVQRGEARVLRRQIAHRFGEETAGRLGEQLEELSGPEGIAKVTDALIECGTGEEFIERVRMG